MRKSKYLVAGVAAVALSVAGLSTAQAAVFQNQQLDISVSSGKQDKKKAGPVNSFTTDIITNYTDEALPNYPNLYATNTKVYFPKDFVFTTKGLPQCDPNTPGFAAGTSANAISLCGPGAPGGNAQVGGGTATLTGPIAGVTAVITAFNGTQPGGLPTLLLHSESSAGPSVLLTGTLKNSDVGGFGKMLDVPVDISPFQGTEAITDFKVTIPKTVVPGKAASSAKKKKKKKKFYISAKCSKKKWNFRADSTYNEGNPGPGTPVPSADTTATDQVKCKQKPSKKKK